MSAAPEPGALALEPERLEALLARYDRPVPRYTSYPTVPVWTEDFGPEAFRSALAELAPSARAEGLALYVHVPFCRSLCHFCACNRIITRDPSVPERYLETMAREVAVLREAAGEPPPARWLHWGGGTPTHLAPEQLRRLHETLTEAFPLAEDAERSIEVDPRVTSSEHVEALRALGYDRISLGVQDFDPRVQEAIHRVQPVERTAELVRRAREAGFTSVGFDLIYGLPYQSEASFGDTLDTVLELLPDRIALYSYAHVTWKARQQRGFERKHLPDARTKLRLMVQAIRRLTEAGYLFVGLDHFARPDDALARALRERRLVRSFMGHTAQKAGQLLGFGPSAISELAGVYAQSARDLGAWEEAVRAGRPATMRGWRLSAEDAERRWIIAELMCHAELRAEEYAARFGGELRTRYARELERLAGPEADGLVVRHPDGSLRVTPVGRLLARNVAAAFDAYLERDGEGGAGPRRFSRAV